LRSPRHPWAATQPHAHLRQLLYVSLATCLQLVYKLSAICLHLVCKLSATCNTSCLQLVYTLSATCPHVVCNLSTRCWPTRLQAVVNLSTPSLQLVCKLSATCLRVVCSLSPRSVIGIRWMNCPQIGFENSYLVQEELDVFCFRAHAHKNLQGDVSTGICKLQDDDRCEQAVG
jgi:hypothetical protein